MANLKDVKVNDITVIDEDTNIKINENSCLNDKNDSGIIDSEGKWLKSSIIRQGNDLSIDISSSQNTSLDIKNSGDGSASLKVNGGEIVNSDGIVNASVIEDKFLRNDQDDETTGRLTVDGVTSKSTNRIHNGYNTVHYCDEGVTEKHNIDGDNGNVASEGSADYKNGYKVNNTTIIDNTGIVQASQIEDKFLRNDSDDSSSGGLSCTYFKAEQYLEAGNSSNKKWYVMGTSKFEVINNSGISYQNNGSHINFTNANGQILVPFPEVLAGSVLTKTRIKVYTDAQGYDQIAYKIYKRLETGDDVVITQIGSQQIVSLDGYVDTVEYDLSDVTIVDNYQYWVLITIPQVMNFIDLYSFGFEFAQRRPA